MAIHRFPAQHLHKPIPAPSLNLPVERKAFAAKSGDTNSSVGTASGLYTITPGREAVDGEMNDSKDSEILVYPNPGKDIFQVRTQGLEGSQLRVTDVLGREILRTKILMNETQVELSHTPSGTYFFRIEGNTVNKVVKVVKR